MHTHTRARIHTHTKCETYLPRIITVARGSGRNSGKQRLLPELPVATSFAAHHSFFSLFNGFKWSCVRELQRLEENGHDAAAYAHSTFLATTTQGAQYRKSHKEPNDELPFANSIRASAKPAAIRRWHQTAPPHLSAKASPFRRSEVLAKLWAPFVACLFPKV